MFLSFFYFLSYLYSSAEGCRRRSRFNDKCILTGAYCRHGLYEKDRQRKRECKQIAFMANPIKEKNVKSFLYLKNKQQISSSTILQHIRKRSHNTFIRFSVVSRFLDGSLATIKVPSHQKVVVGSRKLGDALKRDRRGAARTRCRSTLIYAR